jgi:rhodanese-related sulfurtransferase
MTYKTAADLIAEAKRRIPEVTVRDLQQMRARGEDVLLLDVREPNEWNLGRIPGAMFIPRGTLETKVEQVVPRERRVVIYCASGNRSALAADTMREMGYADVSSLAGGWIAWAQSGGDVED